MGAMIGEQQLWHGAAPLAEPELLRIQYTMFPQRSSGFHPACCSKVWRRCNKQCLGDSEQCISTTPWMRGRRQPGSRWTGNARIAAQGNGKRLRGPGPLAHCGDAGPWPITPARPGMGLPGNLFRGYCSGDATHWLRVQFRRITYPMLRAEEGTV